MRESSVDICIREGYINRGGRVGATRPHIHNYCIGIMNVQNNALILDFWPIHWRIFGLFTGGFLASSLADFWPFHWYHIHVKVR